MLWDFCQNAPKWCDLREQCAHFDRNNIEFKSIALVLLSNYQVDFFLFFSDYKFLSKEGWGESVTYHDIYSKGLSVFVFITNIYS